ncbi:putative Xaa-Pro aminopeptidase P [Leucoagaricus sp. SymC.cos]|nr:putative Xaa-Pro aminopeptidase P [Leucoagaricus sp. SymC.cos]
MKPQPLRFLSSPSTAMSWLASSSPGMGLFKGAHNFLLNNPTIVANYANQNEAHAIQLLGKYSLPGAEFDSSERDPPPRCPPSAHLNMLADLQLWAHNPLRATSIQWVRGPAGVGKTAIMQTFSELEAASEASILGATLFFSRANRRNDPQRVFTTIAYQLAIKYPSYRKHVVEIILHDPRVVQKSMAEQFKRFILQPVVVQKLFEGVHETILIILDGLDKCKGERRQQEIVSLIRQMTTQHPASPLIWLIASRPEPHIRAIFGQSSASLNREPQPSINSDQRSKAVERDSPDKLQPNREPDPTPISPSENRRESSVPPLTSPLPPTPTPLTNFPTSSQTQERRLSGSAVSETPSWHPRGRRPIRPISKNELERNEEEAEAELTGKPRERSRSLMTLLSQSKRASSPDFESHRPRGRDRELVPPIPRAAESSHGIRSPQSPLDDDYDYDVSSEPSDSIAHSNDSKLTLSSLSTTPRPRPLPSDLISASVGNALERRIEDVGNILGRSINTTGRLANLRTEMEKAGVDYYIVLSEDAHGSECVAACDKRLEYITGFTGPKGDAVITRDSAYLVTGPRYWPQAETQTDRNWTIIKAGVDHGFPQKMYKDWVEFFLTLLSEGQRIGIDARMISHEKAALIHSKLESLDCKFVFPRQNLVDLVWRNKPGKPRGVVYVQGIEYTGRDTRYKLYKLREWIQAQPPSILSHSKNTQPTAQQMHVGMLVNSLACIAWTLNLRGLDILFNPLFRAYLFIGLNKTILFLDSSKIDEAVTDYLEKMVVERRNYMDLWSFLRQNEWGEGKLLVPPSTSYAITLALTHSRFTLAPNRVEYMMALKNDTELEGLRMAYIRDGVAFVCPHSVSLLNLFSSTRLFYS